MRSKILALLAASTAFSGAALGRDRHECSIGLGSGVANETAHCFIPLDARSHVLELHYPAGHGCLLTTAAVVRTRDLRLLASAVRLRPYDPFTGTDGAVPRYGDVVLDGLRFETERHTFVSWFKLETRSGNPFREEIERIYGAGAQVRLGFAAADCDQLALGRDQ